MTCNTNYHSMSYNMERITLAIVLCLTVGALARPHPEAEEYAQQHQKRGGLYEGIDDIIGEKERRHEPDMGLFSSIVDRSRRWPDGIIPYTFVEGDYTQENITNINSWLAVMQEMAKVGDEYCVEMIDYTDQDDYVLIGQNGGCSSSIGCNFEGAQDMSLDVGCLEVVGTTQHEFLHAYGIYHEQSRGDRDEYVYVNYTNIEEGKEHNFDKKIEGETIDHLGTPYDYDSVMHYGQYGFAIDDDYPTITPLDEDAEIGQRDGPSPIDIERIQILYECITPEQSRYHRHLIGKDFLRG